jgi:hypothetical protein
VPVCAGSIEHAIDTAKLTADGDVWEAEEEDLSLSRESSSPFHIFPYLGKYGCVFLWGGGGWGWVDGCAYCYMPAVMAS